MCVFACCGRRQKRVIARVCAYYVYCERTAGRYPPHTGVEAAKESILPHPTVFAGNAAIYVGSARVYVGGAACERENIMRHEFALSLGHRMFDDLGSDFAKGAPPRISHHGFHTTDFTPRISRHGFHTTDFTPRIWRATPATERCTKSCLSRSLGRFLTTLFAALCHAVEEEDRSRHAHEPVPITK